MRGVTRVVQFDAEEVQAFADSGPNCGAPFSNPSREHERVEAAESGGERSHPFLRLVAEQRHGFSRPDLRDFTREQISHIRTEFRYAEQP